MLIKHKRLTTHTPTGACLILNADYDTTQIGKAVFFTKEEAEKALKERNNEK